MNNLLNALGSSAKRINDDKYTAICPVHHGNKNHALSIKRVEDGSVIAHCFSCGANGLDVYNALGLDLDELFGGKKKQSNYMPNDVKDLLNIDRVVVKIHDNLTRQGNEATLADKKRYKLAKARIIGVEQKFNINNP